MSIAACRLRNRLGAFAAVATRVACHGTHRLPPFGQMIFSRSLRTRTVMRQPGTVDVPCSEQPQQRILVHSRRFSSSCTVFLRRSSPNFCCRELPLTSRRDFCTAPRPCADSSLAILGLDHGASQAQVKQRFYELAKLTHPDAVSHNDDEGSPRDAGPALPTFIEVLAAFECLMSEPGLTAKTRGTAPSDAQRGGAAGSHGTARRGGYASLRRKSLSEVLCERLEEDPAAASAVWADIKERQLPVVEVTLDLLFRACARSGAGLPEAISIMRDATRSGKLTPPVKAAALVSLIKWCKEDKSSFEVIINEVDESERTPEVLETMSYANFLYSGIDGYSK